VTNPLDDPAARAGGGPKPRVLLVGKGAPDRGGIATFLQMLLDSDIRVRHDARLLNVAHSGTREGGRFSAGNVGRTARDAWNVWRESGGVDIVHIHSALAPASTILRVGVLGAAARLRRRGVVVHAHGGLIPLWMHTRARRWLARLALAPARKVIAVSVDGYRALEAVVGGRALLLDNGVDTDAFCPSERVAPRVTRILYVGLLTPRKGLVDLFEASKLLLARGVDHELLVLGGAPDEGEEAEREVRAAAPAHARFLGVADHSAMPAVYAGADVFCLPSWWEAAPLSVLEAMASGVCVVATAVGDIPRLAPDGTEALLVPPQQPAALAAVLERVVTDPDERSRLAANGRRRAVEHFSAAATSDALSAVYCEVAGR
jgi:glycosyltransferase involved in cell wall biosynthesis